MIGIFKKLQRIDKSLEFWDVIWEKVFFIYYWLVRVKG